jgi:hypothetical protein
VAPLPAPRAAKQSIMRMVVVTSDGVNMRLKKVAVATRKTMESVVIPPIRSASHPPKTLVNEPVSVARTVGEPA